MLRQLRRRFLLVILAILVATVGCTFDIFLSDQSIPSTAVKIRSDLDSFTSSATPAEQKTDYQWRNVQIEGMGFVTGLVIHPTVPDLIYIRTDAGGAFRWDSANHHWLPLMDQLESINYNPYSVESIALDPQNPDVVYVAVGDYTKEPKGEILKSTDRGESWTSTDLRTPDGQRVRMGGNEDWRWAGERLVVDPSDSQVLYFGSRLDGLYHSIDGAKSWQKVADFPNESGKTEVSFIVLGGLPPHRNPSSQKRAQNLHVGLMGGGVYSSLDGGSTWKFLDGQPDGYPQQAILTADGSLYVTFFAPHQDTSKGGVWQYTDDQWLNITPVADRNYSAIAVDPHNSDHVLVTTFPLSPDGLYRSIDGGKHWQSLKLNVRTPEWWPDWHLYTLMGGLAIDPHHANRVWLTNGFGVLRTEDISANPSDWSTPMANLEELVTLVVKSPPVPGGAALLSGVADMAGFRHERLTAIPRQTYDKGTFGDTTGIDFSEANPNIVVRVGSSPGQGGREDSHGRGAYSSDNGRSWQSFSTMPPGAANGKVAVSATLQPNGYPVIVWAPQGEVYPYRSLNGGRTWLPVKGAPNRTTLQLWFGSQALTADCVDGYLFYLYKYNERPNQGTFYRSTDSGETWQQTAIGLPDHWLHSVKAVPFKRGEVWLSVEDSPLLRSHDAGISFQPLANVQVAEAFAFGKAAPGRSNPTVFIYGVVNQSKGLFRSDDATSLPGDAAGAQWVNISQGQHAFENIAYLEADLLVFGRVYVGTAGRGIFYGDPKLPTSAD
jgi:xyloglucan-specific exo-beta-1,4-glucanase